MFPKFDDLVAVDCMAVFHVNINQCLVVETVDLWVPFCLRAAAVDAMKVAFQPLNLRGEIFTR